MSVYVYLCVFCLSNLLNLKVTCTITRRNKSLGLEVRLFITLFCVSVAFSLIINHPSAIRYYRCSAAHHAFCDSCHLPVWSLSPSCPFIVELAEPEASLQALICPWVAGEDSATMHAKHMEFFQLAIFRRATSRWWDGCWLQPQSWFPDMVVRWFLKKRDPPGDPPKSCCTGRFSEVVSLLLACHSHLAPRFFLFASFGLYFLYFGQLFCESGA